MACGMNCELGTLYVTDFAEGLLYFSFLTALSFTNSPCFLLETGITPNYKEQYYIILDPTIRGTCPAPIPTPLSSLLSYDEKRTGSCNNMQEVSDSSDLGVLPRRGGDQNSGSGKNV